MDHTVTPMLASRPGPNLSHVVVAIPVRDEAARIGRLLTALARAAERTSLPVTALILANNCSDDSVAVVQMFSHPALRIEIRQTVFPAGTASAGRARRMAMDLGAQPGALLMTTDADATPGPDWIAAALDAVQTGADLVCGTIITRVPHVLATLSGARITRAEVAHAALQHEIRHCLNQLSGHQPWGGACPHYMESGASMAIRADSYLAIGGLPARDHSEDRALVHLAGTRGLGIRYLPGMTARVSARLQGRAEGGMAACLRHRMQDRDPMADQAMLTPDMLRALWMQAQDGRLTPYPCRTEAPGPRLRASDLEAAYPALRDLVEQTVRPDFARILRVRDSAVMAG